MTFVGLPKLKKKSLEITENHLTLINDMISNKNSRSKSVSDKAAIIKPKLQSNFYRICLKMCNFTQSYAMVVMSPLISRNEQCIVYCYSDQHLIAIMWISELEFYPNRHQSIFEQILQKSVWSLGLVMAALSGTDFNREFLVDIISLMNVK